MICTRCKKEIPEDSRFCNHCGAAQEKKRHRAKRAHGLGSVCKLSGRRKKPWQARRAGTVDEDGNVTRQCIGMFATRAEAEAALERDRIAPASEYANITLKALYDMWKKTHAYTDLTSSTQANYTSAMKRMKSLHGKKFSDLRTAHLQEIIDKGESDGLSRSTLEKVKALLTILSKYAYSQDIVSKNYAMSIRLPRAEKKTMPTFTETEIAMLFKHSGEGIVDTILILIYTGMRISELLDLTKFNVDIDSMLITGGVKTDAGKDRVIPIHKKIQSLIRARYQSPGNYLVEYDKEIGNKAKGTHEIVRSKYAYGTYLEAYYDTLSSLGIRRLTPHKARHTFFTMLSERCTDRKGMAMVGGHSDPGFTEKIYVQPDIERLRKVIDCL